MKTIKKDELYKNLKNFLKTKGVELQEGSYTQHMQQGCGLLADTINLGQSAFEKAKGQIDKRFEKMRQVIHEKTAPKAPPVQPNPAASSGPTPKSKSTASAKKTKTKAAQAKTPKHPRG